MSAPEWRSPDQWRQAFSGSDNAQRVGMLLCQVVHAANTPRAVLDLMVEMIPRAQDQDQLEELTGLMGAALHELSDVVEALSSTGQMLHRLEHRPVEPQGPPDATSPGSLAPPERGSR